jgi:fibro-slime domain-containing protein
VLWVLTVLLALSGCGARTPLEVERCGDAGMRACTNVCGEGVQQCVDGYYRACEVPPTELPCEDVCGVGMRSCVDGELGACEVPPTEIPCENACGFGVASCVEGTPGRCAVPPAELPCENACGVGTLLCQDGVPGPCATPPSVRACSTACGDGEQECVDGTWGRCSADVPRPPVLDVVVRDFLSSHADFEAVLGPDRGIVEALLGPDDKPVYVGPTPTTHGRVLFDQWYRDVPGVNMSTRVDLELMPHPDDERLFVYDNLEFFPIDDMLFGNEGWLHNFHFTLEASTEFIYQGGETFRFRGDDDVFVFINRRLAIDLGGVHSTEEATVALDAIATSHGLVLGERHPIHLFFAERHTDASNFTVETTVADRFRCE